MEQAATFDAYRPLLFSIAYRMLGTAMDAEDMVQEAYLRWQAASPGEVQTPRSYLATIVTRLCIDHLRSAKVQREDYLGPWLPEPIVIDEPAESAALADSLSIAFLVVLERLSPVERAVFLLREVFEYGYDEIARMVDKSEANCRQMVKRARDHLAARRPRFKARREEHERLLAEFSQAALTGDLNGLMKLFADDITVHSDGGGKTAAARRPVYGVDKVARFLLGVLKKMPPGFTGRVAMVNGQPAVVGYVDGRPYNVLAFEVAGGRIQTVYNILNPDKLKRIPPLVD